MSREVRRDGDTWAIVWPEHQVGFGVDRLRESGGSLYAELTIESTEPGNVGRLHGPTRMDLLSADSQTRLANALAKRNNHADWHSLVVQVAAVVTKQYREPSPTLNLAEVEPGEGVAYLLPRLVPQDETTVLYADGESGKSLLALRIAASVATGMGLPWGERPAWEAPVLYLDWETNPRTVAGRLRRIASGMDLQQAPAVHYRQMLRSLEDELMHVRYEVSRLGIGLVVVDSIGFACRGALVEDETARNAMNALRQIGVTRLVVAHISAEQARQTSGKARPFGSTFFWNGMRSGIEVRRGEEAPNDWQIDVGLFHRKANDGEHHKDIGLAVTFEGLAGPITFEKTDLLEVPDLAERTRLSDRIRQLLRAGGRDTTTLARDLNAKEGSVLKTLKRMPDVLQLTPGGGRGHVSTWGLSDGR